MQKLLLLTDEKIATFAKQIYKVDVTDDTAEYQTEAESRRLAKRRGSINYGQKYKDLQLHKPGDPEPIPVLRGTVFASHLTTVHRHVRAFEDLLRYWLQDGAFPFAHHWVKQLLGAEVEEEAALEMLRKSKKVHAKGSNQEETRLCNANAYTELEDSIIAHLSSIFLLLHQGRVLPRAAATSPSPGSGDAGGTDAGSPCPSRDTGAGLFHYDGTPLNVDMEAEAAAKAARAQARNSRSGLSAHFKENFNPFSSNDMSFSQVMSSDGQLLPQQAAAAAAGSDGGAQDQGRPLTPLIEPSLTTPPQTRPPSALKDSARTNKQSTHRPSTDEGDGSLNHNPIASKAHVVMSEVKPSSSNSNSGGGGPSLTATAKQPTGPRQEKGSEYVNLGICRVLCQPGSASVAAEKSQPPLESPRGGGGVSLKLTRRTQQEILKARVKSVRSAIAPYRAPDTIAKEKELALESEQVESGNGKVFEATKLKSHSIRPPSATIKANTFRQSTRFRGSSGAQSDPAVGSSAARGGQQKSNTNNVEFGARPMSGRVESHMKGGLGSEVKVVRSIRSAPARVVLGRPNSAQAPPRSGEITGGWQMLRTEHQGASLGVAARSVDHRIVVSTEECRETIHTTTDRPGIQDPNPGQGGPQRSAPPLVGQGLEDMGHGVKDHCTTWVPSEVASWVNPAGAGE